VSLFLSFPVGLKTLLACCLPGGSAGNKGLFFSVQGFDGGVHSYKNKLARRQQKEEGQ
jgi:hypothetical protein